MLILEVNHHVAADPAVSGAVAVANAALSAAEAAHPKLRWWFVSQEVPVTAREAVAEAWGAVADAHEAEAQALSAKHERAAARPA